jgi:hypothetical protein
MITLGLVFETVREIHLRIILFGFNPIRIKELDDSFYELGQAVLSELGVDRKNLKNFSPETILDEECLKALARLKEIAG